MYLQIIFREFSWKAGFNDDFKGLTLKELRNRLGLNVENKDVDFSALVKFLRDSYSTNDPHAKKSKLKDEEWAESVRNTGFNVDLKEDLLKYWYTPAENVPNEELHDTWNWRDINGVSYLNDAIQQVYRKLILLLEMWILLRCRNCNRFRRKN